MSSSDISNITRDYIMPPVPPIAKFSIGLNATLFTIVAVDVHKELNGYKKMAVKVNKK